MNEEMNLQPANGADQSIDDTSFLARLKQAFIGTPKQTEQVNEDINPFAEPKQVNVQQTQQIQQVQQAQPQGQNQLNAFNQYVQKLNFLDGIEVNQEELLQDPTKLTSLIGDVARQAYGKAMTDSAAIMDKILEQRFSDFSSKMMDKMKTTANGAVQMERVAKELPLMKDPSAAPIIGQVMSGFLRQGKSADESLQLTKDFLQKFSNKVVDKDGSARAHRNDLDNLFSGLL